MSKLILLMTLWSTSLQGMVKEKMCSAEYEWAIVGAGPAGIIVVGLLMDLGIQPHKIAWIDPEFSVGRLSSYAHVPANSTVRSFLDFLKACKTFSVCQASLEVLYSYGLDKEPPLKEFVAPLQKITDFLCSQVCPVRSALKALDFEHDIWNIAVEGKTFSAQRVVLATGSHPRSLNYACEHEIPLDIALDKKELAQQVHGDDTIAVVGSAHSAVLIMKFLSELPVGRIINFYNKPLQYVQNMGTWILHPESGLKGVAAEWARNVLEKNPPANLIRLLNTESLREAWLPICNKIVYAAGFERTTLPPINGSLEPVTYDATTGVIAPHLFGIGIAFPEVQVDPLGHRENRVGLNSFMAYAQRVTPEWLNKDLMRFKSFEKLFIIDLL
jgi:hypothetical protein